MLIAVRGSYIPEGAVARLKLAKEQPSSRPLHALFDVVAADGEVLAGAVAAARFMSIAAVTRARCR
jgi:hypothetical protein